MSHISDSLLPNHFAPPMLGSQVDAKVFKILLRKHLPTLASHLDELGLDPGMVLYVFLHDIRSLSARYQVSLNKY